MATIEKEKALDVVRQMVEDGQISQEVAEKYFPELKESEDERIWIINYLSNKILNSTIIAEKENLKKAIAWVEKQGEQKPAECSSKWDISDFRTWQYIVSDVLTKKDGIGQYVDSGECKKIAKYMQEEWSKKLSIEQNPAWSEEDDKKAERIIRLLQEAYDINCIKGSIEWLKSFKDRVQPKREWSEEDECCINQLIVFCENCMVQDSNAKKCANWLKSLKPQNRWKPSERQLECLGYAIDKAEKDWSPLINNRIYLTLKALKEQLLELKGSKV